MDDYRLHSRTFIWPKTRDAVPFVKEMINLNVPKAWHDNRVRVTVPFKDTQKMDAFAEKHGGMANGPWKDTWK